MKDNQTTFFFFFFALSLHNMKMIPQMFHFVCMYFPPSDPSTGYQKWKNIKIFFCKKKKKEEKKKKKILLGTATCRNDLWEDLL